MKTNTNHLSGIGTTALIPETKRRTLEELGGEEPAASDALNTIHGHGQGNNFDEKRESGSDNAV